MFDYIQFSKFHTHNGDDTLPRFVFFFFFLYWLYNPGWVLVCSTILFHTCLSSIFTLQPIIFILLRSSSTWSIHLNLGLPTGLVLFGFHSVIFLVVLVFSILITWATHLSLCVLDLSYNLKFVACNEYNLFLAPGVTNSNHIHTHA